MLCGIYDDMVMLNEIQLGILGWIITIGGGIIVSCLSLLVVYCIYCLYKVIRNFSKKY